MSTSSATTGPVTTAGGAASGGAATAPGVASGAPAVEGSPASLQEELALLDAARARLARGDAAGTLAALDAYQQRFPRGSLGLEAHVLRINALWSRGDQATARQLGERFIAAHPTSPHSPRLRGLLGL
ncbi:MAG: outer membrane protein assembly factor BamD [Myxococcales bacterium]|nr:MAG: outer membrane protein assembly factor BamD [Myxococcales bacterium]